MNSPAFQGGVNDYTLVPAPSLWEGVEGWGKINSYYLCPFAQANNIILKDLGESPQEYGLGRLPSWAIHNLPNLVSYISIG